MDAYVEEIRKLKNKFAGLEIHHVDRDNNVGADVLPNSDLLEQPFHLKSLFMNFIIHQSKYKANKVLIRRPRPQSEKYC